MAACKPITFQRIDRLKFKAVRARINAQADNTSQSDDAGTAEGSGFSASYSYDDKAQTLTIQCTDKPFFIPESLVEAKIRSLVESV